MLSPRTNGGLDEVDFNESANTQIPGGELVNIAFLLIIITGVMGKSYEKWKYMMVGRKNWKTFNDNFARSYRRYQIRKNQQPLPMNMALHQTMRRKQTHK